jgi:hypothetical protein
MSKRKSAKQVVMGIAIFCVFLSSCISAYSESEKEAAKKAEEIHNRALSDVIYVDEELKALYYQNIQIISLLKDIRALLKEYLKKEKSE